MSADQTTTDGYDCFRQLIQHLRDEHFDQPAQHLDFMFRHVAWTSSSELIGELGTAIREFQHSTAQQSRSLRSLLDECMQAVLRVWPDFPK